MRRWIKWLLGLVVLVSIGLWWAQRDVIPRPIRLAAGVNQSNDQRLARALARILTDRGYPTETVDAKGSKDSVDRLQLHQTDLAIVKGGATDLAGVEVVSPLYPDVLLLIVRRKLHIQHISELKSKKILIGSEFSGTNQLAIRILEHYRLKGEVRETDLFFKDLAQDQSADGALLATPLTNPDLIELMQTGEYELLPIDEAPALATLYPFFHTTSVPAGIFIGEGPVPRKNIQTLAIPCLLVGTAESSPRMISHVLDALFQHRMRLKFPTLYRQQEAAAWSLTSMHPAAHSYFDPYRGLSTAAAFLSSLSAIKELLVASLALFWLVVERSRRLQQRSLEAEIRSQKVRLSGFIGETINFERELLSHTRDRDFLDELYTRVTHLKVQALEELTHEALRSDQDFAVFLSQCRELIDRIRYNRDRLE
ncbi:hypothetical protein JST97_03100 [bacterium]|nr:hypothetical protein [bacterium]